MLSTLRNKAEVFPKNMRIMKPIVTYGSPKDGIKGQSFRVMLNGGLSPLRWNRTTVSEPATLNLASAGQKTKNVRPALLRNLPPKRLLSNINARQVTTASAYPFSTKFYGTEKGIIGNGDHAGQRTPHAFLDRSQLQHAKRIIIKLGSAVVTREDQKGLALGRLASIVEQIAELQNTGHECILITSGAVAFGKQKLSQEVLMSMSMRETIQSSGVNDGINELMTKQMFKKPNAAVGQSGLQALYETMFRNYGIIVGQVLVTKPDFYNDSTREQLFATINELMALNIIPIINTNDAVSPPAQKDELECADGSLNIKDNDSLAARVAVEVGADLAILMSDVNGIYDRPPDQDNARILHTFNPRDLASIKFGEKSSVGTGGMESKVLAAKWALDHGTTAIICNGMKYNTIKKVMSGEKIGSMFTNAEPEGVPVEILAQNARNGSRKLLSLSPHERAEIISNIADSLVTRKKEILDVNRTDLDRASAEGITGPMYSRLAFTEQKLTTLSDGLKQIADQSYENVGRVIRRTKVSDTLDLVQRTVPIGVLMVIFESRPDALPQVASLAIASANGLLMKGGKEATNSNNLLMNIVKESLGSFGCSDAISLVSTREAIGDLLKMDEYIDLVIPRGSTQLVQNIKEQSKMIPVLGHAEGVCHVFIDKDADLEKAMKIVIDAKTDYPAACNAMETLLIHEDLMHTDLFDQICFGLKEHNVKIFSGPNLSRRLTFGPPLAPKLHHEYGDLACTIELVKNHYDAVDHIHKFGSSHTDVIVTENEETAQSFTNSVDSACVFVNCSTRMADGYRMGLGAEVGISTGRIHARGPVGVEGLLTTKWILNGQGDTAVDYATGKRHFLHQQLPLPNVNANYLE